VIILSIYEDKGVLLFFCGALYKHTI